MPFALAIPGRLEIGVVTGSSIADDFLHMRRNRETANRMELNMKVQMVESRT